MALIKSRIMHFTARSAQRVHKKAAWFRRLAETGFALSQKKGAARTADRTGSGQY
jgi:hypothetical protein